MLRSGAWAVFVFAVGVFGCGCDFSTAHRISGDRAVRCRAQRPDVPSGFPVVIQQRVIRPVANGLLADDELMHIEDETVSIQRLPSGVSAAAWSGASSIVADDEGEISLWQDQIHPCARSSDVLSVGLDGDAVFWTNWNEPQRTVELHRSRRTAGGCTPSERLFGARDVNVQLARPLLVRDRVFAVETTISRQSSLVEVVDGGLRTVVRLPGLAHTCRLGDALVIATGSQVLVLDDAGVRDAGTLAGPAWKSDCGAESLLVSSQSETGATIVRIDAHGRIVDRRNSSSYVSALGLSPDGWIVEDQILKRLSGDWVKSADAWRIDSVWAQDGAFHATIGRGRLLVARDGRWTLEPKPGTSSLGEVPNARGGTVHLFRREDGSVVLQDGPDVVRTFPRPSWTEEGGRLRSWSSDSCSGDLLIEVQFDSVFLLGLRRDGMWSFSPPPLFPYFVAGLDGDELLLGSDQSMIRFRSDADEGWVRVASSPLDSASTSGRALVSSGGLVVEDEEGVRFDREGERFPLASPGAQLLGASDGWAFIRDTGNVVAIELP